MPQSKYRRGFFLFFFPLGRALIRLQLLRPEQKEGGGEGGKGGGGECYGRTIYFRQYSEYNAGPSMRLDGRRP